MTLKQGDSRAEVLSPIDNFPRGRREAHDAHAYTSAAATYIVTYYYNVMSDTVLLQLRPLALLVELSGKRGKLVGWQFQ